ncbi:Tyrosine recombinase XerD [Candidatus Venteria ishoeyi]|uniref:Tyrosine recombinase XerD n=2 Tax=Candidatus Venteria ishoeyi TaxID=1899563 RepID=A0A1H6F3J9_9GAMM|nr:Tyrosine recombinase XerD [Candidatus Venteria ishoeyi]
MEHCSDSPWVFCQRNGNKISSIKKSFKCALEKSGIDKKITIHTLRHTFISWLVQAGQDIIRVKQVARHANINTTMRYSHLSPDEGHETVKALFQDTDF